MITRRTFLAAMATASLAPLVGCSGGQQAGSGQQSSGESKEAENRSEPKPLEITESGWSVVGDGWVYYGFALKNTNKDVEAQMPTVTITGKAEDGSIVFSDKQTLFVVLPGETVHYGFQAGNGTAPATVEFKANEPSWVDSQTLDEDVFTVSNTAEVPDSYGGVSYTGELTANYDLDKKQYSQVAVSVIARDASGAINYGNTTFVDTPSKGESEPFEISCFNMPEHSSFEVYAQVW